MRRENLLGTQCSFGTLKSAVLCPKQTVECYSFKPQCLKTEYGNTKFLMHNLYGFVHGTAGHKNKIREWIMLMHVP